jgi:SulP family sulfate permease
MLQFKRLIKTIFQEFRSHRLFPNLTVGLVIGGLEIIFAISLSALIFSGDLSEYLPTGIGIALFSILMLNAVVTWMSSLPGVVANVQESSAALTAVVVHTISMNMPASASATEKLLTVVMAIASISIVTGIFFFALGWFKLGNLIRFVPYPVVGGFLAGTGWLLVCSSLTMMTNVPLGFSTIVDMLSPSLLIKWLPGLLFAVLLLMILRHFNHFLILPSMLLGAIAVFYIVLKLTGTSINQANSYGLLIGSLPSGNLWRPFSLWEISQVHWLVIFGQVGNIITILLVSVVTLLLNATGIEVAVEQDIDLNRELQAAGMANIAAGCGGGIPGFQGLALSVFSHKVGTNSRLVGLFISLVAAIALFSGAAILSYLPKLLLGGLLLFLGLDFLCKWVYDSWFQLPKTDCAIILLILIVIATFGFLQGVGIGLLLAVVLFTITYSQISAIENILSGASYHSHMLRQPQEKRVLQETGKQICILYQFNVKPHRKVLLK